jgi:Bacterial Ig-like domain (group 1)
VQTHVVRAVFLVLCLSMLTLQHGCSNSGSGQAEAPASNANAVQLALSTTNGTTAVMADGRSTIPLRIQVTNGSGTGMAGVPVTFATTAGALSESPTVRASRDLNTNPSTVTKADSSGRVTVTTDTNGVAQVLLTASTTAGTAAVTADALGFRTHIDISFVPGPAAGVQLNASPNTVNAGGTSTLTAIVKDANGNLVPGASVTFTLSTNASGASLSPTSGTTDINGQMTVQYTAGTAGGADTVRAQTSNSVVGVTSITVTAPLPGPGTPVPSRIDLLVSSPQLDSDGTKSVTLTALVRDAANNVLSGIPVSFSAPPPSSASIQVTSGTTGATGTATALLTTGGDPSNRTITVTATTGNLSSSQQVQVIGTTLTISGARTLVLMGTSRLSLLLRDSGGNGIQNKVVTLSSTLGNTLSATTVTTDSTGQATVTVIATVPGTDTIQALALGATGTATLSVSAADFAFTAPLPDAEVPLNTPQPVTVHWEESGVPVPDGRTVNFFTTRGTLSAPSAKTVNGIATVTVSSAQAGSAVISAVGIGPTESPSSQLNIEFRATMPSAMLLQAIPTTLGVNATGSTAQQSVITAIVQDTNGNLVADREVSFLLTDTTGGTIFPASAITDNFGRASTVYTAGAVPSAQDGVIIQATVIGTTVVRQVKLTVARQSLFVTLGTGNLIQALSSTQYAEPYSVLVTDANGNPVANAAIELSVLPTHYQKGIYVLVFDGATCKGWVKGLSTITCPNEDLNLNGVLDRDEDFNCNGVLDAGEDSNLNGVLDRGEDFNGNCRLDPGNVATTVPGSVVTDASGFAFFNVVYAKEFTWVEVVLQARATVAGSEGSSRAVFFLPGLASDFSDCNVSPPGVVSPYGMAATCDDPK